MCEGIVKVKFEIIIGLKDNGMFIYDGDELLLKLYVKEVENVKCISIGVVIDNVLVCFVDDRDIIGILFMINNKEYYDLLILGKYNMKNVMIVIVVGYELGLIYNIIY